MSFKWDSFPLRFHSWSAAQLRFRTSCFVVRRSSGLNIMSEDRSLSCHCGDRKIKQTPQTCRNVCRTLQRKLDRFGESRQQQQVLRNKEEDLREELRDTKRELDAVKAASVTLQKEKLTLMQKLSEVRCTCIVVVIFSLSLSFLSPSFLLTSLPLRRKARADRGLGLRRPLLSSPPPPASFFLSVFLSFSHSSLLLSFSFFLPFSFCLSSQTCTRTQTHVLSSRAKPIDCVFVVVTRLFVLTQFFLDSQVEHSLGRKAEELQSQNVRLETDLIHSTKELENVTEQLSSTQA